MGSLRDVAVLGLGLLFASLQSAVSIDSNCVSHLPHSENELWSFAQGSTQTLRTVARDQKQQLLFPNATFDCNGSIVGWSMIASQLNKKGGRPVISVWRQIDMKFKRDGNISRLLPCLKSQDGTLYLYENVTERPMEFQKGDFLGMLLRSPNKTQYEPYFIHNESFVSYYDNMGSNPRQYTIKQLPLVNDSKMPLLFLHICSKGNGLRPYQRCIENYRSSPPQCVDPTSSGDDGISHTVLAIALVVPLGLVLLIVLVVLVVVLLYIWLVRRGRGRKRAGDGNKSRDVTENNGAIGEAEPYAEPVIRLSAPLPPPPRTQSPLPPPPTHAPPPVPGLSVKPTYATLERPTPSPPPPYDLDLENNKPMRPTLQSPEYESIDKIPSKMALVQQNEKSQTVLAMTMQQQ